MDKRQELIIRRMLQQGGLSKNQELTLRRAIAGEIDPYDAIDSATSSMPGNVAVYVSNIMKYLWRHHRKHNRPLEDVLKAKFFFDKLIKYYAQNKTKDKQED